MMWKWIVAGVVGLALAAVPAAIEITAPKKRSGTLTNAVAPAKGWVAIQPSKLAEVANLPVDTYTMARVIASESDAQSSPLEREAIAWVCVNEARRRGGGFTAAVTSGTGAGYYGAQDAGGRWISTARDPSAADAELARQVLVLANLDARGADPTGGATRFFHVSAQDAKHRTDPGSYKTSAAVLQSWLAEGFAVVPLAGISPSRFVALRKGAGRLVA